MNALITPMPPVWVGYLLATLAIAAAFAASARAGGRPVPATTALFTAALFAGMGIGRIDILAIGAALAAALGGIAGHARSRPNLATPALRLARRKLVAAPFKTLLTARFSGALTGAVPVAAARQGVAFHGGNLGGAVAWALAVSIGGLVLGVALRVVLDLDPRAAALLAVAVIAVGLALLLFPPVFRVADIVATRVHEVLARRLEQRDGRVSGFVRAGIGRDRAVLLVTVTLAAVLVLSLVVLAKLTLAVIDRGSLVDADEAISNMVRIVRTPSLDTAMIIITTLGDTPVTSAVAAAALLVLLWRRAWRVAMAFAVVLIATAIAVPVLKAAFGIARPTDGLYAGPYSYSYPSGHAAFAAAIYLPIAAIAGRGRPFAVKMALLALGFVVAAVISFSRVYVAAHWPSDVMAGMLFGLGCLAIYMLVQRHLAFDRRTATMAGLASVLALAVIGGGHVTRTYAQKVEAYRLDRPEAPEAVAEWRQAGWRALPAGRHSLRGAISDAFVLQWAGDIDSLAAALGQDGWRRAPAFTPGGFLTAMLAGTEALSAPVLPRLDRGHAPEAIFLRAGVDGDHRQVLRVWATRFRAGTVSGPVIHVGAITEERMMRPLGLVTWPRRDGREPDGAPILARVLPSATIVTREAVAIDELGDRKVPVALAQPQSLAAR